MSTSTTPTILQSTFLGGAAAVFAVNFTHPIELVKSRVQVNNMGVVQTISDTMKNEGIAAFWKVRWLSFQWYSRGGFFSRKECGHCCLHPISRRDATTERLAEISRKMTFRWVQHRSNRCNWFESLNSLKWRNNVDGFRGRWYRSCLSSIQARKMVVSNCYTTLGVYGKSIAVDILKDNHDVLDSWMRIVPGFYCHCHCMPELLERFVKTSFLTLAIIVAFGSI